MVGEHLLNSIAVFRHHSVPEQGYDSDSMRDNSGVTIRLKPFSAKMSSLHRLASREDAIGCRELTAPLLIVT